MDDVTKMPGETTDDGIPSRSMNKQRIALSVLHGIDALESTIKRLGGLGIDAAALTVIAGVASFAGELARIGYEPETRGPALVMRHDAASGPAQGGDNTGSGIAVARFEAWATPGLSRNLDTHLAAGDVVLVVPVANTELETPISEILLETATETVQIHDIRVPSRST